MRNIVFLLSFSISFTQVLVNEYSASNLSTYADNYNMEEDWIELFNSSDTDVDISGYYLSDKADNPTKWSIPGGTIIPAHGYLVFWCSGRDEVSGDDFHTNFKLKQTKSTPEHVVFTDSNGEVINDYEMQKTQLEHSMGRSPNGSETWRIFNEPTLGTENGETSYITYADIPEFSLEAGFYNGTQTLEITTQNPDLIIKCTTNGNVPSFFANTYEGTISISETQVVKAIAYSSNPEILPSFVTFSTFFIDENHTLPVLSTSANNLTTMLNGNQSLKPHGTIEYFEDGERKDFGYGEYNKHGQDSWAFPQRSFDYIARDEMGYHDAIHEKLISTSERDDFQRIIIRASGDDNYPGIDSSAHMRDVFIQKLADKHKLNVDMRRGERCVVYANGQFWGVYSIREKVSDADYTNFYYGQDKYNTQYLMNWGWTWAQYGGQQAFDDWGEIHSFAMNNDLSIQSNYEHVANEIDVTSLVDYLLINSFVVCTDWINWNTSWWRGLNPDGTHKKWGYVLWDEDATFNHYINYTGVPSELPTASPCYQEGITADPEHHIDLLNKLLENAEFEQYYVTRYMDLMNTAFQEDSMISLLEEIEESITPEMPQHFDRWGGNMFEWQGNVEKVKQFIRDRIEHIPSGLNSCYDLNGPYEITLQVEPTFSGQIQINSLTIENDAYPWTGMYHGGIEMLMDVEDENGFDHWIFNNHSIDDLYSPSTIFNLNQDDVITAVFSSSESNSIVINEINYNSSSEFDSGDWVELVNVSSNPFDLSNWIFKDENNENVFVIPNSTLLDEGAFLVLCNDTLAFSTQFPNVSNVIGQFDFGLSGGGERVRLYDFEENLVDEVEYDDTLPWPVEADGEGATLELIDPALDNILADSWEASYGFGSPGAINSVSLIGDINIDGEVNIIDVVNIVNIILSNEYNAIADLDNDGSVSILDVVQLVNIIIGSPRNNDATFANVSRVGNKCNISGNGYIGAIQMVLSHDDTFTLELTNNAFISDFRTINGETTLLIIAPDGNHMFTTFDDYEIKSIKVANSSELLDVNTPDSFSLSNVYPNPFNNSTQINITIPFESHLSLKVYDLLGKEVETLINDKIEIGYHSFTWNADNVASGVYFLKCVSQNIVETRKVILLK